MDQRAHGDSEGHTITFGVRERMDCLLWCRYAVEHFGTDCEIWLNGVSMGASTVLMASNLPLPPQVKGIIADCPYDSPRGITGELRDQFTIRLAFLYPLVRLGAKLFYGFDPEEASPGAIGCAIRSFRFFLSMGRMTALFRLKWESMYTMRVFQRNISFLCQAPVTA